MSVAPEPESDNAPAGSRLGRVLNHQVSIGTLIELAIWLAIPYLAIGFVWAALHPEQVDQIQTRIQKVNPLGADITAFGVTAALWPAAIQIGGACPAS